MIVISLLPGWIRRSSIFLRLDLKSWKKYSTNAAEFTLRSYL